MNKPTKTLLVKISLLIACLIFGVKGAVHGQDPWQQYQIYYGTSLVNLSWALDSSSFVFQEYEDQTGVLTGGATNWHQYSVSTGQTTNSSQWPLQPTLTPAQLESYEVNRDTDQISFILPSPNNRYIVYGASNPAGYLGIADLQSGQHQVLDGDYDLSIRPGGQILNGLYETDMAVYWSADSTAFAIQTFRSGSPAVHYVNNLQDLSARPTVYNLVIDPLPVAGTEIEARQVFDISPNGNQILLHDTFSQNGHFIIWNVSTSTGVLIPSQGLIAGAKFLGNGERILYIDEGGLKQFYVPSSNITVLNPNITSTWAAGGAYFSPNGRYVAINNGAITGKSGLYMIDFGGTNLALFRPDTLQANLLQTLDTGPEPIDYYSYATGVPISSENSQWVMGDWDGDGVETPGAYATNGVFYHTNVLGPSSSWGGTWFGLLTGTAGNRPVAGRFDANVNHDCIGVTDSGNFPPYGTAFTFYFTCDFTQPNPPKTFQWLSILLPDSQGHSGPWEFSAGNFDPTVDAVDTVACRRGNSITWTNTPPTTQNASFPYAQYIGAPHSGTSLFVVGDWNSDGTDSFGLYYTALGRLRGRNDLDWNTGLYPLDQQLDTSIVGTTSISATTWRLH